MNIATRKGSPSIRFALVVGDVTDIPDDMLRLDIAFTSPADLGVIAFPTFKTSYGNLGGHITDDRWKSFGVRIDEVTDPETLANLRADMLGNPEAWATQRHPIIDWVRDYNRFAPITLATFIEPERKDSADL